MAAAYTPKAASVADLKRRIRGAGLRSTGARVAVLRSMDEASTPLTHQEVSNKLASAGFDQATIYRNLTDLTEAGILSRADLGDHVWRFELRRGNLDHRGQHPHFLCIDCGNVACLPEQAVQLKATPGAPRALRRRGLVIQIQGRCDRCERQGGVPG